MVRCSFCYILICGASGRAILTLRSGNNRSEMKTYNPSNQLQWLINFSSRAQARGDVVRGGGDYYPQHDSHRLGAVNGPFAVFSLQIFLLLGGQISAGSVTNEPTSLTLGLSALFVVFLWMFLPYIAVCAVICLGWKVQQHIRRALQSQKGSEQRL